MPILHPLPRISILSQAAGLGLMLYGAVTGAASMVAVGVVVTSTAAMAPAREGGTEEG